MTRGGKGVQLDKDRDLSTLLDEAFGLYRRHLGLFVLLAAAVVVPVDLVVSGIGLGQITSDYDADPPLEAALVPAAVSALVTVPLITAMLVHALLAIARGETPTAGSAARDGLDAFTPVLVVVLLAGLIVALGFVAFIVPGIVALVFLSVAVQSVVVEGRRGTDALRRSFELVRGNGWWTFGVLLVTNLLVGVLGAIVAIPGAVLADAADLAIISLATTIVVEIFTLSFQALAVTILFFTLRARQTGPSAPAGWGPPGADEPITRPHGDGPGRGPSPAAQSPSPPASPPPEGPRGWEPPRPER